MQSLFSADMHLMINAKNNIYPYQYRLSMNSKCALLRSSPFFTGAACHFIYPITFNKKWYEFN